MDDLSELLLYVNGIKVSEKNIDPEETLLHYLRRRLCLTGTKRGCGEGGCGACTVMVSRFDHERNIILHHSVNACITPVCLMHGAAVTTVEGIGSVKKGLHPVQERLVESHGSQCGFCTPGIVMSMYTLLRNNALPSVDDTERALEGNLCRCTGYRPILQGLKTFTKEFCGLGENCCRNLDRCDAEKPAKNAEVNRSVDGESDGVLRLSSEFDSLRNIKPYDQSQEPIFPPELQLRRDYVSEKLKFVGERVTWYRPSSLKELIELKNLYPGSRLVVGNTEIVYSRAIISSYLPELRGTDTKNKTTLSTTLIDVSTLPDLLCFVENETGVKIGASVTLATIENRLPEVMRKLGDLMLRIIRKRTESFQQKKFSKCNYKTRSYSAILEMLKGFSSHQTRNVASIVGNIVTASPVSDLNPLLMVAGATLQVLSASGNKKIPIDEQFFIGYRRTRLSEDDIVLSVFIPHTKQCEYFIGYKQSHRRQDDMAIVNAGMRVLFEENSKVVKDMALAFGGMAATTVMAARTMKQAIGKEWNENLLEAMFTTLAEDLPLAPDAPGGMVEYRKSLSLSFLFKFYTTVQLSYGKDNVLPTFMSAASAFHREATKSAQVFEEVSTEPHECLGRPITHRAAHEHATGEAVYVDDITLYENELYLSFVRSTKAKARILKTDASKALEIPGVVAYIDHNDVPGNNEWSDEQYFATDMVLCQGQVIGVIAAETYIIAKRAAKAVSVEYEELEPIITIKDAIEKQSFYGEPIIAEMGSTETGFTASDHTITGEIHIGGQEHFYLETQTALAVPKKEAEEMDICIACQQPTVSQIQIASVLGLPANRINVRVKRLGGAFGGKETRSSMFSCPLAVAAYKLKRPIRYMLDRDVDMSSSGGRHPFFGKYKVGCSKEGKILAVEVDTFANAGHSLDLSRFVVVNSMMLAPNNYYIPNLRYTGHVCKTNIPSNTVFRGAGTPQSMLITEAWISDIADTLGISQQQVREINLLRDGDNLITGMVAENNTIRRCWDECVKQCELKRQIEEVEKFNSQNRWKKRGVSVVPTKFGPGFPPPHFNQNIATYSTATVAVLHCIRVAGALVHVYRDGSVLLTHGGVEMGQGLHTKMLQVASKVLEIPISKIIFSETSTTTVPNTSPTAASCGSDLNGMAVMNACKLIKERLEPIVKDNPKGTWEQWIDAAYMDRISLSSTGFYRTPDLDFNLTTLKGRMHNYYTYGVACSQVEIDCLTGDHQILKTDIVMDVGVSLNPAIDIGQIEGGFMQGYGLFCLEQLKTSPSGYLYTRGPGTYKIPSVGNIPVEFNVSLLKNSKNIKAVYSSKGIGEPPLFLASSVFFAIKNAIASARQEEGIGGVFRLDSPATPERIRLACKDRFTDQCPAPEEGTFTPWFVTP